MTKLKQTHMLVGIRIDYTAKCEICNYFIGVIFTGSSTLTPQTRFACINCCNKAYIGEKDEIDKIDEELDEDLKRLLTGGKL